MKSLLSFLAIVIAVLSVINNAAIVSSENHHTDFPPVPSPYINEPTAENSLPFPTTSFIPVVKIVGRVYCYGCTDRQNPSQSNDKKFLQGAMVKVTCNGQHEEIVQYGQTNSKGKYHVTISGFHYWLYGSTCNVKLHAAPSGSDCTVPVPGFTEWDNLYSYTMTPDAVVFKAKLLAFAPDVPYECDKLPHGEVPPLAYKSPPPSIVHTPHVPTYHHKSPPQGSLPVPHVPTYQYTSPPPPVIPTFPPLLPLVPPPDNYVSSPPPLILGPMVPNYQYRSPPPPSFSAPLLPRNRYYSPPPPSIPGPQIPTYQYNTPPPPLNLVPQTPTYQYKSPPSPALPPFSFTPTPRVPINQYPPPPASSLPIPQVPSSPPTTPSALIPQAPSYNPPLSPSVPIPQIPTHKKFPPPPTETAVPPLANYKYSPPQILPTYQSPPPYTYLPKPLLPPPPASPIPSPLAANSHTGPLTPPSINPPFASKSPPSS